MAFPAMLVPAPRDVIGTPFSAHSLTVDAISSTLRGNTTQLGTMRWLEASEAYAARVPLSAHTSPVSRRASSRKSSSVIVAPLRSETVVRMDSTDYSLLRLKSGSHPADLACIFCSLISDDNARWVAKEDRAVAFFPLQDSAIAPGQTLVIPRSHTSNGVLDVDPEDLAATMSLVQRVSNAMQSKLGASGVCVLNASGPNSGRSVDHLHFHVVPRYPEDGEDCLPWPAGRSTHEVDGDPGELLPDAFGLPAT